MKWSEFRDTAERLAAGIAEGDWRSGVSRGYYAVYHYFREFFLAHGLNVGRGPQTHSNLALGLQNCGFPVAEQLGRTVDDLRTQRMRADYDLPASVTQTAASAIVFKARQVVEEFENLLTTVPAGQLVANATAYLKAIKRLPP